MSDMGTFRTTVHIENHLSRGSLRMVDDVLVDTGSEFTWIPEDVLHGLGIPVEDTNRFVTATGARVERDTGYAIVHAAGTRSTDEVVFAKAGDMILLGARSLEGMNLRVDPRTKQLVPAGPILAGAAA